MSSELSRGLLFNVSTAPYHSFRKRISDTVSDAKYRLVHNATTHAVATKNSRPEAEQRDPRSPERAPTANVKASRSLIRLAGIGFAGLALSQALQANPFPFVLPWDDASSGITDISDWLTAPVDERGRVTITDDGHFSAGGERIRFLGVNMSFAGGLPAPEDGAKIAARLARFGVNIVRFHHLDTRPWPDGLRAKDGEDSGTLHPKAMARMDQFIAELRKRGIYVNLNLLVGRPFDSRDNLPAEIETLAWKDRHLIGFFNREHLQAQQLYARRLLAHENPHTGLSYAEDPAVAFVEINNEQGLVHGWLGGKIDGLPQVFRDELSEGWRAWLRRNYQREDDLRAAWSEGEEGLGNERLRNPAFAQGPRHWRVEQHGDAGMAVRTVRDLPATVRQDQPWARAIRFDVYGQGEQGWHLQFNQSGLALRGDTAYTVSFWARASSQRSMGLSVSMAHAPWESLGLSERPRLGSDWRKYSYVFRTTQDDANARLSFSDFGPEGSRLWLTGVSFRPGGIVGLREDEQLDDESISAMTKTDFAARSPGAQRAWMRFLVEKEDDYWQAMYQFLKEELGVRGLIAGTIAGCSPLNVQAKLDWVDTHAYWQHPRFPNRPWDPEDWTVENRSMVREPGGKLPGLALRRVLGKPHAVTEYNHPAPNTFGSEAFLLLAAYGALQDWDAIYVYSYAHSRPDGWDNRRITGFFDIDQHPTKMVTLPAAAAFFRRGDIAPATQVIGARLGLDREIDLLRSARSWSLVSGLDLGIAETTPLLYRTGLAVGSTKLPSGTRSPDSSPGARNRFVSDTRELIWDLSDQRGFVTLNTPRSKAVIGYAGQKRIDLGGVRIEAAKGLQKGWCAITITAVEGRIPERGSPMTNTANLLVTATGYAENTGMKWKNSEKTTVGSDWGRAPSQVEGIDARISFAAPAGNVSAWALDERGRRRQPVAVRTAVRGASQIQLSPDWRTLWYEVEVTP